MKGKKAPAPVPSSFYIPLDMAASINESDGGVQGGETCRIDAMKDVFAWMRGFVNGWYGWANDGKGTFTDFLCLLKVKYDKYKICSFKPEDMDTVMIDGNPQIKANGIYKNLAWQLTGKPWIRKFAQQHGVPPLTVDEEIEALRFITKHVFIIYPEDRKYNNMLDNCKFMHEQYGIDIFFWDPFNEIELPPNERGDERLVKVFREVKQFAMKTNTCFNIVSHPRSMGDVKEKNGVYKVVNQFMQLGGAAWDIKMDGQFSIHRPFRHEKSNDPRVHFYNLKQRKAQLVGVGRGVCQDIVYDSVKNQYYFNGLNPMDGTVTPDRLREMYPEPSQTTERKSRKKTDPPLKDFSAPAPTEEPIGDPTLLPLDHPQYTPF